MNNLKLEIDSVRKILKDKEETIEMLETSHKKMKDDILNTSRSSEVSRLRKRTEELMQENKLLRKGQDVLNKSRDLSM